MLYDWGLHHLHLSDQFDDDGFTTRTEDLLFGGFLEADAYLIDIAPHGSWYLRSLLEAIVLNWPEVGLLVPMKEVVGLSTHFSEEEGRELREAGVAASSFEFMGRVWTPRDWVTTAGTSVQATRRANVIMHAAEKLRATLRSDADSVLREFNDHVQFGLTTRWEFIILGRDYGIREHETGATLIVGRLG